MPSEGNLIPVVYRLNLRDANSFFLARAFPMKDKDILYVANAPSDALREKKHAAAQSRPTSARGEWAQLHAAQTRRSRPNAHAFERM